MERWVLTMIVLGVVAAGACGPIGYVNDVTRKASDAVDEAKAAEADKYAPYWWTRATQYLHKARENVAHADYQSANRFGRLAAEAAREAIVQAEIVKKDPSKGPLDLSKVPAKDKDGSVAPAKDNISPAKDTP